MNITFHRAFDVAPHPFDALEAIIALGCNRVLSSGQAVSVPEGSELLRDLVVRAGDRIRVMPGGGITARNIQRIAHITKAQEFHVAPRIGVESNMTYRSDRNRGASGACSPLDRLELGYGYEKTIVGYEAKSADAYPDSPYGDSGGY